MYLLQRALQYGRTVRHLRGGQFAYQLVRRTQARGAADADGGPQAVRRVEPSVCMSIAAWPESAGRLARAENALAGRFVFLGRAETFSEVDWRTRYVSHLWSYNLHYFDYAVDLAHAYRAAGHYRYVRRLEELALGWIDGTASGRGDGWEPYAISLRVVNWAYALWLLGDQVDAGARGRIERSMLAQLAFLERRLELHILANHLQKNLKALTIGGLYFSGPVAERWLRKGVDGLWRELFEQVLSDGGHYERSPMYHAIALGDYLEVVDLLRSVGEAVPERVIARLNAMVEAFGVLSRPDGALHLFNDAANGIAPEREWLHRMASAVLGRGVPVPVGHLHLQETGYHGYAGEGGDRLLIDCGDLGPGYQPGHGHCDLLSFELDVEGRPLIVDSGVSGYEGDPLREYVRSTRAHNTVLVNGKEQAEVWGIFRLARRPRVRGAESRFEGGQFRFDGAYSPFHDPRLVHRRVISGGGGTWRIADRVTGRRGLPISSFLHLHPRWEVVEEDGRFRISTEGVEVTIEPFGFDEVGVEKGTVDPGQGWYCPEFGVAVPAAVLVGRGSVVESGECGFMIRV